MVFAPGDGEQLPRLNVERDEPNAIHASQRSGRLEYRVARNAQSVRLVAAHAAGDVDEKHDACRLLGGWRLGDQWQQVLE